MAVKDKNPEFVILTGPMFSSKTTSLLAIIDRLDYQKRSVILFKASEDDRFSETSVTTHTGHSAPAHIAKCGADILKSLADSDEIYDVVAVDEAFMIEGVADVLAWLYKKGVSIFISSLTLSYNLKVFKEMEKILPHATKIEVKPAVCTVCGRDAFYTYRKNDDNQMIVVGGSEIYEARCWEHHPFVNKKEATEESGFDT